MYTYTHIVIFLLNNYTMYMHIHYYLLSTQLPKELWLASLLLSLPLCIHTCSNGFQCVLSHANLLVKAHALIRQEGSREGGTCGVERVHILYILTLHSAVPEGSQADSGVRHVSHLTELLLEELRLYKK